MYNFKKIAKTLVLAAALTGFMASSSFIPNSLGMGGQAFAQVTWEAEAARSAAALAASNKRPKVRTSGFSERVYKILSKATEYMDMEPPQYAEALEILKKQNLDRVTTTERISFYQMMAGISQNTGKYDEALGYYQKILKEDGVSYAMKDSVTFIVGQLLFQKDDFEGSLRLLNEWLKYQANPSVSNIVFMSNVYYSLGAEDGASDAVKEKNFRIAIANLNWVIKKSELEGNEVKENWYAFLRMLHNSLDDEKETLEIAELLTSRWPKKEYWTQLSGLYAQKAATPGLKAAEVSELEAKQIATYELAYRQGMLDKGRELESMAQLYLYHEMPFNSSKVMAKSLKDKISKESEKNLDLLALGYIIGKDSKKAIAPLEKAAKLSDDGNLYIRLANVYLNLDMYQEAADSIGKGLAKGGVKRADQSSFLQGQAYMALEKFDDARKSFREAAKDKRSEKTAKNWLKYLVSEEKRIKEIKEYLS